MFIELWNDESGLIISAELIILLTIGVIALVVGLTSLRDSIVTELADVGQAISNANQSYYVFGIRSPSSFISGFGFTDQQDFGDNVNANAPFQNSRCIVIADNNGILGTENR